MRNKENPMRRGRIENALTAASAARRKRWSAAGAVCTLALLTAAVMVAFVFPGPLNISARMKAPRPTSASVTGAPNGGTDRQLPPEGSEAECVAVPLEGGDYSTWKGKGIGHDGSYNLLVEPGKLDETLKEYGLAAAPYDSQAANTLVKLQGSENELRLVLEIDPSSTPRLNAVGLYIENGAASFAYTDCAGENPRLYTAYDEAIGCKGFLVEVPKEAAGLPFSSGSVSWDGLPAGKKTQLMLERIMMNPEMKNYLYDTAQDSVNVPELFLTKSPMETGGIFSLGQEAWDWLQSHCAALKTANSKPTMEYYVLSCLLDQLKPTRPPVPANTPVPTPEPVETDPVQSRGSVDGAFQYDLDTHILSQNGAKAGAGVRVFSTFIYLKEPLDSGSLAAAVLTSVQSGEGSKPTEPELFLVDAIYKNNGKAWELDHWTISPNARPRMEDFSYLRYRSWDSLLYTMYAELNARLSGLISKPFLPRLNNTAGRTVKLLGTTGTLRWYRLSEWVQREKGAGTDNIDQCVADYPGAGAAAGNLLALSGGKWESITEKGHGQLSKRSDKTGLKSAWLELYVAGNEGLWYYSCQLNVEQKNITLSRSLQTAGAGEQKSEWYVCRDKKLYETMMLLLNVNTDLSNLLINDDTPSYKLPFERDELKHLVMLVGDMPGGIAAIHPSILHNGGTEFTELKTVDKKSDVISWAQALGSALGNGDAAGSSPMVDIDSLPVSMAAQGPEGSPSLLKWDFDVAAQEGRATLTLYANPVTGQVWSETTYRLFGTTDINRSYMKSEDGDKSLYLLLTELTFGREIENPEELP
jgi:hypothetical protein